MNDSIGVVTAIALALLLPLLAGAIAHLLLWLEGLRPRAEGGPDHEPLRLRV